MAHQGKSLMWDRMAAWWDENSNRGCVDLFWWVIYTTMLQGSGCADARWSKALVDLSWGEPLSPLYKRSRNLVTCVL